MGFMNGIHEWMVSQLQHDQQRRTYRLEIHLTDGMITEDK
jgi:hypothetical protein